MGFELFEYEARQVAEYYPLLKLEKSSNGRAHLIGFIEIKDDMDSVIETYNIDIYPTMEYPYRYPIVFEIGGRIPRNINWHVFEDKGNCCLGSIPEEISKCAKGLTLLWFLNEIVVSYFYAQIFKRENGYFLKERPHGVNGDIDFYSEVLRTKDIKNIINLLSLVKDAPQPTRTSICFCGSGIKYRKCHKIAYDLFGNIGSNEFSILIKRLVTSEEFKKMYPLDYFRYLTN